MRLNEVQRVMSEMGRKGGLAAAKSMTKAGRTARAKAAAAASAKVRSAKAKAKRTAAARKKG